MLLLVVFLLSGFAAVFLGVGWVMQQRVATGSDSHGLLSWTVLKELISSGVWWLGIAAMTAGQSLSAWALQFGPVSSVEPVLVGFLLVAFVVSAASAQVRPRWQEMTGPVVVIIALSVFLAVADPKVNRHSDPGWHDIAAATIGVTLVTAVVASVAKLIGARTPPVVESALLAGAAGLMYGLQDAATRGAIVVTNHHSLIYLISTMWPWVVLGSATVGVLLSQAAFRAERLDFALPPTAAAQPIAGVAIGVTLLGDRLSATGIDLALEALCVLAMLAGVVLIGRSPAFET
jgi:hypothetical protein